MMNNHSSLIKWLSVRQCLVCFFALTIMAASAFAQSPSPSIAPDSPSPSITSEASPEAAPPPADPTRVRLTRARALAAAHNLAAAATELDAIISATTDDMTRDVARIMLMGIFLEEADYTRADALLVQTYQARSANSESSLRGYFALAGQTINGARAHMERYRSYGINVGDKELPPDALNDLDRLRLILERVAQQAREISDENLKSSDASALLEDVASMRGLLARDEQDRQHWRQEFAGARERLAASETRIASVSGVAAKRSNTGAASSGAVKAVASSVTSQTRSTTTPERAASSTSTQTATGTTSTSPQPSQPSESSSATAAANAQGASNAHNSEPMNVGSLVEKATQKVAPLYPSIAKSVGVRGVVTIYLEVDEKGNVAAVRNLSGPQMLRQSATNAAWRWKFKPTLVEGQPVRVTGFINFNFTL